MDNVSNRGQYPLSQFNIQQFLSQQDLSRNGSTCEEGKIPLAETSLGFNGAHNQVPSVEEAWELVQNTNSMTQIGTQQHNLPFSNQQRLLPQHLALQLSLLVGQQNGSGGQQNHHGIAFQPSGGLDCLSLLVFQHISSALGLQTPVGNHNMQQLQAATQTQDAAILVGSIQLFNRSVVAGSSVRSSTVAELMPHAEEQLVAEGSTIVPCRARGVPKDHHNAQDVLTNNHLSLNPCCS